MNEPRKASDILLSLESKIDQLIALYRSQDLVLKVLSNKLNTLTETVNNLPVETASGEADPSQTHPQQEFYNRGISVSPDFHLPVEVSPKGFRRTSRPETFSEPEKPAPRVPQKAAPVPVVAPPPQEINLPIQFPEFVGNNKPSSPEPVRKNKTTVPDENAVPQNRTPSTGKIPVEQRVVDKNGKAIFLANVELLNANGESEYKTRTNGVGKWQASLSVGKYQVKISKQESVSKEKIDRVQDITVDGLSTTQTLPVLICN